MKYFKNIAVVLVLFLALIGFGNALGYLFMNKAPWVPIAGVLILAALAAPTCVHLFKKYIIG